MTKTSHWIFVINDTDKEFKRRLDKRKWPIFHFTINRKRIRADDLAIFYKAGAGGQKIIGKATTASAIISIDGKLDFYVKLKDVEQCNDVSIRPLVKKLEFIKNKQQWGGYLQGGVRPITEKDYETIVSKF